MHINIIYFLYMQDKIQQIRKFEKIRKCCDLFDDQQRGFDEKQDIFTHASKFDLERILSMTRLENILKESNRDQLESYFLSAKKACGDNYDKYKMSAALNPFVMGPHQKCYKKLRNIFKKMKQDLNDDVARVLCDMLATKIIKKASILLTTASKTFDIHTMYLMIDYLLIDRFLFNYNPADPIFVFETSLSIIEPILWNTDNEMMLGLYNNYPTRYLMMEKIQCLFWDVPDRHIFVAMLTSLNWTHSQKKKLLVFLFFSAIEFYCTRVACRQSRDKKKDISDMSSMIFLMDKNSKFYIKSIFDTEPEDLIIE